MSGRRIGSALVVGVAIAAAIDVLLQIALGATRGSVASSPIAAALLTKAVWGVAALIFSVTATWMSPGFAEPMNSDEGFRFAGGAMVLTPVVWWAASLLVFAIRVTVVGAWDGEGRILWQPEYYARLVETAGPWMLAGTFLKMIARHAN